MKIRKSRRRKINSNRVDQGSVPDTEPEPPQGLRLEYPDGDVLPVEVVYVGERDGIHTWRPSPPITLEPGVQIRADVIPGRTGIEIQGPP